MRFNNVLGDLPPLPPTSTTPVYRNGGPPVTAPETVLQEAARIIDGQRQDDYGDPEDSFQAIADVWNWYFDHLNDDKQDVTALDVAHMMLLLKMARLTTGQPKRDSYVDAIGYLALAARISGTEGKPDRAVAEDALRQRIPDGVDLVRVGLDRFYRTVSGRWKRTSELGNSYSEDQLYTHAFLMNSEVKYL